MSRTYHGPSVRMALSIIILCSAFILCMVYAHSPVIALLSLHYIISISILTSAGYS